MDVLQDDVSAPLGLGPTAVTMGFFDGVHLGHQAVIGRTVEVAKERSLRAVAITFDRHPREIITPGQEPKLLTTLERKASLIEALGIESLLVLPFTEEFSHWPPRTSCPGSWSTGWERASPPSARTSPSATRPWGTWPS